MIFTDESTKSVVLAIKGTDTIKVKLYIYSKYINNINAMLWPEKWGSCAVKWKNHKVCSLPSKIFGWKNSFQIDLLDKSKLKFHTAVWNFNLDCYSFSFKD